MSGDTATESVPLRERFTQGLDAPICLTWELRELQSAGACASCGSYDACQGGCMAAKFFTGLPLDGPDPECVFGHGEDALAARDAAGRPGVGIGHSKVDRQGILILVPTPLHFRTPARI
jgi:mycofactocin biosynthetic radical S-adenosylmethionine protein MftC